MHTEILVITDHSCHNRRSSRTIESDILAYRLDRRTVTIAATTNHEALVLLRHADMRCQPTNRIGNRCGKGQQKIKNRWSCCVSIVQNWPKKSAKKKGRNCGCRLAGKTCVLKRASLRKGVRVDRRSPGSVANR